MTILNREQFVTPQFVLSRLFRDGVSSTRDSAEIAEVIGAVVPRSAKFSMPGSQVADVCGKVAITFFAGFRFPNVEWFNTPMTRGEHHVENTIVRHV